MAEIVKVTHLKKSFGRFEALKDVSFTVHSGEVVGFIGPNGSGKSTTIRTLLGIIKKTAERQRFLVKMYGKIVYLSMNVFLMFQVTSLYGEI